MTAMEFDLLRTFVERPGRVLTRDQLLDLAHNRDMEPFDRSIDLRIMRLRRKIEDDPAKPAILKDRARRGLRVRAGRRTEGAMSATGVRLLADVVAALHTGRDWRAGLPEALRLLGEGLRACRPVAFLK